MPYLNNTMHILNINNLKIVYEKAKIVYGFLSWSTIRTCLISAAYVDSLNSDYAYVVLVRRKFM